MSEGARILRLAEAPRMPWKNGGGETVEVAVHPPGAALDAFGWRVSLATITQDGPFSSFGNVDRTFAVFDGDGLVLTVGGEPPMLLDRDSGPVRFAGEAPCRCSLSGGPATALNVMVERGSYDCAVSRCDPARGPSRADGTATLLICAEGEVATRFGRLGRYDALILPPGEDASVILDSASARAVVVSLWRDARHRPATLLRGE